MNSILEDLKCPVCVSYMVPPIRKCIFRHSVCHKCYVKLDRCPLCRTDRYGGRNYELEDMFKKTPIPCENATDGCPAEPLGVDLIEHQEFCHYRDAICPLNAVNNCLWDGKAKDALAHCKQKHPRNAFSSTKMQLLCPKFRNEEALQPASDQLNHLYHLLFQAHGELFRCVWDIDIVSGFVRWCVIYLGPRANASKYYFHLEFENKEDPNCEVEPIRRCGPCQPYYGAKHIKKGSYILINIQELLKVSGQRGLYHTLSIKKNGEGPHANILDETSPSTARSSFCIPQTSIYYNSDDPLLNWTAIIREFSVCDADDEL